MSIEFVICNKTRSYCATWRLCVLLFSALLTSSAFGQDSSVSIQHVTDPDVVSQLDAIVPPANWSVQLGNNPVSLTRDQVTQIITLATNEPLVDDIEVCGFQLLNVTGDSSYELLVRYGVSGRHFCNFIETIRHTATGYDVQSFDNYRSSQFNDFIGDGVPELGLMQYYSDYEGARGCQAQWTSWFVWNGSSYDKRDSSFPAWYQKRHDDLSAAIQTAQGQSGSGAGFDLDESCDIMERDRIERFLGISPKAGLDRALTWATSNAEQLQTRAVVVLANINDLTALQALQTLAQSSNPNVAYDAQQALSASSFSLVLGATTISLGPSSQGSLALNATVRGGFADSLSFTVAGLPAGVTARFSPTTLTGAGGTTLTLTVAPSALVGTYNLVIVAVDSADPSVTRSIGFTLTVPASSTPTSTCRITYTNTNDWGTGFTGSIAITNNATSALNGWTLAWTWPGTQQITGAWNANYSQTGVAVTLTNLDYNASLAPGATLSGLGFNVNYSGSNPAPTAFFLNGSPCGGPNGTASAPPAAPASLAATAVSSGQINLTWTASATAGATYKVYASTSSGVTATPNTLVAGGLTGTTFVHQGVTPSTTYYYVVTAINAAGESGPSNQASAATGGASCQVSYVNQNDWGNGFTGALSITNTSSSAIQGWTLTWTWAGNQQITNAWNANSTQNGSSAILSSLSSDNTIAPGANLTGVGFNANYSGLNTNPSALYLNGVQCSQ